MKHRLWAVAMGAALSWGDAAGQTCVPRWSEDLWAGALPQGTVRAQVVFDDGRGPRLWIGGAGAGRGWVATWDGQRLALEERFESPLTDVSWPGVYTLAVHDGGRGPALHAGGNFAKVGGLAARGVARLGPRGWEPLGQGLNATVRALASFDEGSGPRLFAGGAFTEAGGAAASAVARWDGGAWSPLGEGLKLSAPGPLRGSLAALCLGVHDDGAGPALFVGGTFDSAGPVRAENVARWNGRAWSALGEGLTNTTDEHWVLSMRVFDDGRGPALLAGGLFDRSGARAVGPLARWDGVRWTDASPGLGGYAVASLAGWDVGLGPTLAAGSFVRAGGGGAVHIWNGAHWIPVALNSTEGTVRTVAAFGEGPARRLYAGGDFYRLNGGRYWGLARWDGLGWSPLPAGGADHPVSRLRALTDRAGPALYAMGSFEAVAGRAAPRIARFDGSRWEAAPGTGLAAWAAPVDAAVFDDGRGPTLHLCGTGLLQGAPAAHRVVRLRGEVWEGVPGTDAPGFADVLGLATLDDGSGTRLYAFGSLEGGVRAWDGVRWSTPGGGLTSPNIRGTVSDLCTFDDGAGPQLHAAWERGLSRLGPSGWESVPGLAWLSVAALLPDPNAPRPALYAAGVAPTGGDPNSGVIARLRDGRWTVLAAVPRGRFTRMSWFGDGPEPSLYAAGAFESIEGVAARNVARWDGARWHAVPGGGAEGRVDTLAAFDAGGPSLWLGGAFREAGGVSAGWIARLRGCHGCSADCDLSTGPGVLDVLDFLCFQNLYDAADPAACDCDTSSGSRVCDALDFLCYLRAFAAGCP